MAITERLPSIGNQKSIIWRILLPLVVLIVLSNAAIIAIIMGQLDAQLLDSTKRNLINESELQAVQFRANMLELTRDLQFLAETPPIQGLIRAKNNNGIDPLDGSTEQQWISRLETIFSVILKAKPKVQIRLIGHDGVELVRVDRYGQKGDIRLVSEAELQNKSQSRYFTETIALAAGSVYLSEIGLNREFGEIVEPTEPVIRAATPIYSDEGRLFGIVIINHNLQATFDALKALAGVEHPFLIANHAGEYLVHPESNRSFAFEFGRSSNIAEDFPAAKDLLNNPKTDVVSGIAEADDHDVVYALRSFSYNPENGHNRLILAASHDFRNALAFKDRLLNKVYFILCIVLLLITVVAVYVAKRIASPIVAMRNALKRDGLATRSEDLPIHDDGELGELARVFDHLLQELSHRQDLLEKEVVERKVIEKELRLNNQKLASLNKDLEQFTYIASHDLQEPLRTVQSFVELFTQNYDEKLDDQAKVFLGFINESTERMTALIRGLLDYGRLGAESSVALVSCEKVVADVCADLALRIADVGGVVEYSNLPVVMGRETELRLLFQNLISNGLKFSRPDVKPKIVISAEKIEGVWQFSVRDNGIGIAGNDFQRVFLIFQRLHGRDKFEGSGIGLAHCKKIVELHDGNIWLESELNKGSVFYFTLGNKIDG
ncbi:ATP-binding protein [Zhongshania sp.]|uniref:ATP-binding protein n=3 Tax=Zhongshania sp. TaxID=1971902 RepID=UPI003567035C